jgi:hypothetical protein
MSEAVFRSAQDSSIADRKQVKFKGAQADGKRPKHSFVFCSGSRGVSHAAEYVIER